MLVDKDDFWSWKLCGSVYFNSKESTSSKKVGVFVWRVRWERLPGLSELDKRGIDLHSVLCPLCDDAVETVDHALFSCKKVREIWDKVFKWWGFVYNQQSLHNILNGSSRVQCSENDVKIWQAMIWVSVYLIWKNRDNKVFKKSSWSPPIALCDIQVKSFEWIRKRCNKVNIEWLDWLHNPHVLVL
ncbi:uncharacterized protein [Rutidosis leptorrhynchoides]|uniref:uncharacterized protein n=1 Tax=Rutidosis leptorrhynchoides TaxID=125765 RepID=UPI003A99DC5B